MVGKLVVRASLVVAWVLALGMFGPGLVAASSATVSILTPTAGENVSNSTPSFAGATGDTLDSITVQLYAGTLVTGTPVQTLSVLSPVAEAWEVTAESGLINGPYTVVAEQAGEVSAPVTFNVEAPLPVVTIEPMAARTKDSTPTLEGSAGDSTSVAVTNYKGTSTSGTVASAEAVVPSGGHWSYTPGSALAEGTYTAQAVGRDTVAQPRRRLRRHIHGGRGGAGGDARSCCLPYE